MVRPSAFLTSTFGNLLMPSVPEPPGSDSASSPSFGDQALKIGVMGSAGEGVPSEHLRLAEQLGEAVAQANCVLITGGCPGLPLAAARGAKRAEP